MRLSGGQARAPHKEAMTARVLASVEPVLTGLGATEDPSCWVAWGDDPAVRYVILAPCPAGVIQAHVRVNVPQEGPRVSGKLLRWNRLQLGELAIEMVVGHRLVSFQAEGHVLRGTDTEADEVAAFALELFAGVDGRPWVPQVERPARGRPETVPEPVPGESPVILL